MGQPVTVLEKPSNRPGVIRYELNRTITGTGHERYHRDRPVEGDRPCDVLARRLFEVGGIDAIHMNANMVTVELSPGTPDRQAILDVIGDLYTYYRPGVEVPTPESFAEPAEG